MITNALFQLHSFFLKNKYTSVDNKIIIYSNSLSINAKNTTLSFIIYVSGP